ncbi:MAG: hypothetical protein SPL16_03815, partial [Eubacteriales bacterium]|nr:hypothetical protein [Clostridiales bacterium]MDY5709836.1 hypothetical protein [Eubacteriales bacterium]
GVLQNVKKVAERHFFEFSHSVLAPMARSAPYVGKALLRKRFCGFAAHVAKSELIHKGLQPLINPGVF